MATEIIIFECTSGLTLTAILFPAGVDTAIHAAANCTEATNRKGLYSFTNTTGETGWHELHILSGTTHISIGSVLLTGLAQTTPAVDRVDVISQAGIAPGAKGGPLTTDAATGLILTGYGGAAVSAHIGGVLANALPAESIAGRDAAALGKLLDVVSPRLTAESVNQTADVVTQVPHPIAMAQIGGTGAWYVEALTSGGMVIHSAGAAVAKSPATLDWSADVTNKPTIGDATAANQATILGYVDCLPATWVTVPTTVQIDTQLSGTHGSGTWGGTGDGTCTQTITVTSGGIAVQGATVEILSGSTLIDTQITNASGVAVPTCNAGTYTLRVSYPGLYASSSSTITVTAAASIAVTLSGLTVTPSTAPGQATGYLVCYDEDGAAEKDVEIHIQQTRTATDGIAYDGKTRTEVSDAAGLVQFAGMWQGCAYDCWRGNGRRVSCTVPVAASFALPDVIGKE